MSSLALAITWIVVVVVIGAVLATWLLARARAAQARANTATIEQLETLTRQATDATNKSTKELTQLHDRLAAIETLLREVG